MDGTVVLSVLNAKYVHASPAPWCLSAGIQTYAPQLSSSVRIVEATVNQPLDDVLARITEAAPAVVGFSCYLWNIKSTLALCAALKREFSQVITVLGGPEVSYCAREILEKNPQIDYILAGEGEQSVPAFLEAVFAAHHPRHLPEQARLSIPGLCGRNPDGSVYQSQPCVLLDDVPSPLLAGYDKAAQGRITYFETSRGCPYSCAFCLSGRCGKPRYFDLNTALKDLLVLANSGTQTIKFVDRTFNANPLHANAILEFILENYGTKIPRGVCFHFEIAGDILREETFTLLQQMPPGAVQLEIGMQSFCEKTLEAIHRKTDTARLQANIHRLVAMGNMHIHIDLIAGLPYEDLSVFAQSFDTGYALGAQMLQLGFLKLLHGSAMRTMPQDYPCCFDQEPPYQVQTTPWLSAEDFELLHATEDAVERVYNSGRFCLTARYALTATAMSPFAFYSQLGVAARNAGVCTGISLNDYTAFLQEYLATLPGIDSQLLRDNLVRDRLSSNSTGRLPPCLVQQDAALAKAVKALALDPATAPPKGVRRGVALLYGAKTLCWVDYIAEKKHPVTGHWMLCEKPLPT